MANINPHITDPGMRAMLGLPPLTGWTSRFREQQGEGATGYNAFYNWDTNTWSDIDPTTVSNPLYAIGQNQAQGEGATSSPVYADPARTAQFDPYRNYLNQVLATTAGGMGRIEGDQNFDLSQYFAPAPAGADWTTLIPQANEGVSKLLQANPGLDMRYDWTPWADYNDFNQRSEILFPDEGWGSLLETPFDAAKDLWAEPGFRQLALTAAGGALMGGAGGAETAAAGGTAAGADAGLAGLIESGAVGTAGGAMEAAALGGLDYASFLGPAASTTTGGAAAAAGGTALQRILNGTGTSADWLEIGGTLGGVGLGVYSADKQSDALAGIAAQSRADRLPFLDKSLAWLNDPNAYAEGPGASFMDATLKRLSAERGNPIDSPTALALATQAGMQDWRNAVTGFANIGLSGEDSRNNLLAGAASADASGLNAIGYGLGELTKPKKLTLADILGGKYGLA